MNMYKCLSGIMHLGNVDFSENDDEQSAVRNKPQLQVVAVSAACSHCTSPACAHLVSCRCGCCDLLCLCPFGDCEKQCGKPVCGKPFDVVT